MKSPLLLSFMKMNNKSRANPSILKQVPADGRSDDQQGFYVSTKDNLLLFMMSEFQFKTIGDVKLLVGPQIPQLEPKTYYVTRFLAKKLHEYERNLTKRGACIPRAPLRSADDICPSS